MSSIVQTQCSTSDSIPSSALIHIQKRPVNIYRPLDTTFNALALNWVYFDFYATVLRFAIGSGVAGDRLT